MAVLKIQEVDQKSPEENPRTNTAKAGQHAHDDAEIWKTELRCLRQVSEAVLAVCCTVRRQSNTGVLPQCDPTYHTN